jgi:hypothetical protein
VTPPEWSGERLVTRKRVAEVLGVCPATVSRNLGRYCVVVEALALPRRRPFEAVSA